MTNDELAALVAGYSKARLEVYLRQVNADPDRAWALIVWERCVAAALWTDIAHCESSFATPSTSPYRPRLVPAMA